MAGASSTPSTGAFRSSSPIARRRSHRTCCGSLRPWLARLGGCRRAQPEGRSEEITVRVAMTRQRAQLAARLKGVIDVPLEADRKRSARHGLGAGRIQRSCPAPGGGGNTPTPAAPGPPEECPCPRVVPGRQVPDQSRVIQDLDPKLDLSNQVEVRRRSSRSSARSSTRKASP
jgi:hypothetical protein